MNSFGTSHDWDNSKVAFFPIKPQYAERLMDGTKRFEFRRRPIRADVTHIVVYASSPCKKILGVVEVSSIECGSPRTLWNQTKSCAGISKADYFNYFAGANIAYAIAIDPTKTIRLKRQINPRDIEIDFVVPQSFKYVDRSFVQALMSDAT